MLSERGKSVHSLVTLAILIVAQAEFGVFTTFEELFCTLSEGSAGC